MAGELIVGRGEIFPVVAELGGADVLLPVLDAHPDGEILPLQREPHLVKHGEGIPGGVSGGQDQGVTGQVVASVGSGDGDAGHPALFRADAGKLMLEAHLTAQGEEFHTDVLHHLAQHVGADVGLVAPGHVRGRARPHQGIQYGADAAIVGAGGELAVGEGARAALPELDVGDGGELTGGPEAVHILGAAVHVPPPLQHDGGHPGPGQIERGKESGGTHAHDDGL